MKYVYMIRILSDLGSNEGLHEISNVCLFLFQRERKKKTF